MIPHIKAVMYCITTSMMFFGCHRKQNFSDIPVAPSLEERKGNGDLYTPSTQSLLRTFSSLESIHTLDIEIDKNGMGAFSLEDPESGKYLQVKNVWMEYLVPRLHYWPNEPADAFDGLNLMLAEFSRNSVSVPYGIPGDQMAHFETNLSDRVPWKLKGDFDFIPNPDYRPLRFSVVNNCLKPGLWELNAIDRSGEIYHSWFNMPEEYYYSLVVEVNDLDEEFVKNALYWKEDEVKLVLDRLRDVREDLGSVSVSLRDESIGFSSQGSRRKLSRNFAMLSLDGEVVKPELISDFHSQPALLSSFKEPGVYAVNDEERTPFDFRFLATAQNVGVKIVRPKTRYNWHKGSVSKQELEKTYLEFTINLADQEKIIIGNLPQHLLVKQEDFVINGFGVGILHPADFAERRDFLIEKGPCPTYAYLAKQRGDDYYGLNSHGRGIEQIFIRSYPDTQKPYWEITITSYERIADLVKYVVLMPDELVTEQDKATKEYISPIYFTYRDDNKN